MSKGRPTKWTPENRTNILNAIKKGANYTEACILAKVSKSLFYAWEKKGRMEFEEYKETGKLPEDTSYIDFLDDIDYAQEQYIKGLRDSVNRCSQKDGKLALDVLARLRPDIWGRKDKLDLSAPEPLTIKIITDHNEDESEE